MVVELGIVFGLSVLVMTAVAVVLLAGVGAVMAVRLIGEALHGVEPEDPFAVSLPPAPQRRPPHRLGRFPYQPPLPGLLLGEEQVQEKLAALERPSF